MLDQMLPAVRRVTDTELRRRSRVEATFVEEGTADHRFGGGELLGVVLRRYPVRLNQASPLPLLRARSRAALLVVQFVVRPRRQPLDRLGERELVDLLHEADDVATFAATEAVPEAARRRDVERR